MPLRQVWGRRYDIIYLLIGYRSYSCNNTKGLGILPNLQKGTAGQHLVVSNTKYVCKELGVLGLNWYNLPQPKQPGKVGFSICPENTTKKRGWYSPRPFPPFGYSSNSVNQLIS